MFEEFWNDLSTINPIAYVIFAIVMFFVIRAELSDDGGGDDSPGTT